MKTRLLLTLILLALAACQPAPPPAAQTPTLEPPTPPPTLAPTETAPLPTPTATPPSGPVGRIEIENPSGLQWNADGSLFIIETFNGLELYSFPALQELQAYQLEEPTFLLDVSAASGLAAIRSESGWIDIVSLPNLDPVQSIQVAPDYPASASISPTGDWVVTNSPDEIAALVWDVASGEQVRTLSGFETAAPVYTVYFAPNGRQLIWWARGTVQLQDFETGELSPQFHHEDFVTAIALSPDGLTLATAAAGTVGEDFFPLVTLWNASSGEPEGVLVHEQPVNALAHSPDGGTLAAGAGSEIILWDVATQQEITRLNEHSEGITALAFSSDGRYLASASSDGTVLVWQSAMRQP